VAGVGGPNEELGVRPLLRTADLVLPFFLLHYQHMYVCGLWVPLGNRWVPYVMAGLGTLPGRLPLSVALA
jgi:hypothetical protein